MKKKTIALSLVAVVVAATTGSIVYAQVVPQGPTLAQVQERSAMAFDRLDVNVDGRIDAADRGEAVGERLRTRFDAADTNRDGALAFEEFSAAREEMRGEWAERRGDRRGGGRGEGRGRDGGGRDGFGRGGMGMMGLGAGADTNGDGAITEAEFSSAVTGHFNRADANDDGVMTREEGRAARQAMRSQAQAARSAAAPAPQPVQGN